MPSHTDQVQALLADYWDCAFQEGEEGRTVDTPDGRAQKTLSALLALFKANSAEAPPVPLSKPAVLVREDFLKSFAELMDEASQAFENASEPRAPLADELAGSALMIRNLLAANAPTPSDLEG